MTRDGDIPTIFNPRGRNRTPSVLVTDEGVANGPFAHADSVSSQQEPAESSSPTAPTGLAAKLKSCSVSLCSKSARKVSVLICQVIQVLMKIHTNVIRNSYKLF